MKTCLLLPLFVSIVLAYGEWKRVPVREKIREFAMIGAKRVDSSMNSPFHYKLVEVTGAERQVVAGFNYKINFTIQETKCTKNHNSFEAAQECNPSAFGIKLDCIVTIYQRLWLNETSIEDANCPVHHVAKRNNNGMVSLHRMLFEKFVTKYKKVYKNEYEAEKRFNIFQNNLEKIKLLNSKEQGTAIYGITKFSDLKEKEFKKYLGFRPDLAHPDSIPPLAEIPSISIPTSFDWRKFNVVTGVKNQKQCGSCWAFSTTGNIEGQWAIKKKNLISLSEQELVDCDKVDQGCEGGLPSNAYKEIIRLGGLETENEYPYEAEDDKCEFKKSDVKVYINSSVSISKNETVMASWLVKNGPISIGINANAMQFYYGGISHPWKFLCNPDNLDHGVLIVGYGVHTYPLFNSTLPFWIIKNSWGGDWGEEGYYRVYRGDGTCGLNLMATSAVVD